VPPPGQPWHANRAPISAFFHTLCCDYMREISSAVGRPADAARYGKVGE
jgi:hypothetical protein